LEAVFTGLSSGSAERATYWQEARLLAISFLPGIWLVFSLSYSRGNYKKFLIKWRTPLAAAFVAPAILAGVYHGRLISRTGGVLDQDGLVFALAWPGVALHALLLLAGALVLMNLERTLRACVGTMRWRIKFMVLGLGLLFAVRIYTSSQCLLYSATEVPLQTVDSIALLLACALMARSLLREGLVNVDVYPSQSFLHKSLTILLAGIYLLLVGTLAKVLGAIGGDAAFPLKAFFVLVSLVALTTLLLSERVRQHTKRFVSRHFLRPRHDYRSLWTTFGERITPLMERTDLCREVAKLVSETFHALSVGIWLVDEVQERLIYVTSTSVPETNAKVLTESVGGVRDLTEMLRREPYPVNLDDCKGQWSETLEAWNEQGVFGGGDNRMCVPLAAGGSLLGLMILGDRVNGIPYSVEDMDLLKCIGDQVGRNLLNTQLSERLLQAKEMEAFQTMSAFFVHDLKNTASTLSLMLQNLPAHFDDSVFRADALEALAKSVARINELIGRLSLLRQQLEISRSGADLNEVVDTALANLNGATRVTVQKSLQALPKIPMDAEQIRKVVTNLLLNAVEAVGEGGAIQVETGSRNGWASLSVTDNGCGMTPEFLTRCLFRPFQTTKKKGIGIGMFLSRMIVDAHKGKIEVASRVGRGTTFRILLPLQEGTR
jgi:putative PEP-CTERM system histidine kinase